MTKYVRKRNFVLAKTGVAGRPKPTLCQHGGEAESAARVFAEDCFASLAMTALRNDGFLQ
jgi:hypothetical protein